MGITVTLHRSRDTYQGKPSESAYQAELDRLGEFVPRRQGELVRHLRFTLAKYGRASDHALLEDLMHETLLRACQLIRRRPDAMPTQEDLAMLWLRRIGTFESLSWAKRDRLMRRKLSEIEVVEAEYRWVGELLERRDVAHVLEEYGLQSLVSDRDRRLLELLYEKNLTAKQASDIMKITSENVRARKARILKTLAGEHAQRTAKEGDDA